MNHVIVVYHETSFDSSFFLVLGLYGLMAMAFGYTLRMVVEQVYKKFRKEPQ